MSKQFWIDAWEDRFDELIESGVPEAEAERLAEMEAQDIAAERLAGWADYYRQQAKEGHT